MAKAARSREPKPKTYYAAVAWLYAGRVERLFVVLCLQHFAATIKAVRADMVTQMCFASGRLDSQLRSNQKVVRTMHAALGWGLLILLDSHDNS